jgi:RNA polymerase sigma-70 factor (ECF subfamily)
MNSLDAQANEFERHRSRLVGLGYRMLGSVAEAEDCVQEVYLRWHATSTEELREPGAWLHTTMTRLCIDTLRKRKARAQHYVGPWLPEPWLANAADDATDAIALADDLSVAFLLLLERLGPDERAAFLLHDIFDASYGDIATALGKSEPAVRQIVSRARTHVRSERSRHQPTRADQHRLAAAFRDAVLTRDQAALISLFKRDATLVSDGGGKAVAALRPIYGADKIVRFLMGITKHNDPTLFVADPQWINAAPGFIVREAHGAISASATLDISDGLIGCVYIVRNPDKLTRIH